MRVRDFPDDLLDEAKSEAGFDGDTLRSLVAEAVQREVERRRAIPTGERRRLRAERRSEKERMKAERQGGTQ